MKLIERFEDAITGDSDLEDLHTINNFPVFMGCVEKSCEDDLLAEQTWQISKKTGVLQLKKLVPLDILYQAQHIAAVGKIWMQHHKAFSNFLKKFEPNSVFEIGGAHGILSVEYMALKGATPWTILEPNPAPVNSCSGKFIKGFFDDNFVYEEPFDTVVHSHVFEHTYSPSDFMRSLSRFMEDGKRLIFSIPNMQVMLERKYTNCINFEHTVFLTEPYIEFLLANNGFKLLAKEYFMSDHSIFFAAKRDSFTESKRLPIALYEQNKNLFQNYIDHHIKIIDELNSYIQKSEDPVYLFGAHVFSQFLILMGLDLNKIVCLLDNDPKKQGKRLYGTSLMVKSPKILSEVERPIVILKAGAYNEEIKIDIKEYVNASAVFI